MTDRRSARTKLVTRTVDCNPPCAGKTLYFEVRVQTVRAAAADELRQVTGPGR
ncbi:MAG: hypothetical protein WCY26_05345 [Thiohalobacteraceae bacterium]|nr:hypothetical protein [Gammaproteobacteria bacterium]